MNLQALDPPEYCNASPSRQKDFAACEKSYIVVPNTGDIYLCEHNDGEQTCKSAFEVYVCDES